MGKRSNFFGLYIEIYNLLFVWSGLEIYYPIVYFFRSFFLACF